MSPVENYTTKVAAKRIEAQLRGIAADLKAPDERREEAPHGDSH